MKFILIFLIPLILITATLQFFFYQEIQKNTEINDFFTQDKQLTSYSQQEIIHLQEVKTLFINSLTAIIIFLLLLIFLTLKLSKQDLMKYSFHGFILTIAVILSLFLFKFDTVFIKFHEMFFSGSNWLLSSDSLLIQQYPQEYFQSMFKKIISIIILTSIIFAISLKRMMKSVCYTCSNSKSIR